MQGERRDLEPPFERPLVQRLDVAQDVLELEAARERTPGRDVEFMVGHWAQCPAAAFVPALLRAVWQRAIAAPATEVVS